MYLARSPPDPPPGQNGRMRNRLSLAVLLLLLVVMVANLGVVVVGLTLATGPVRNVFWVVAVCQSPALLGSAAVAGWRVTRRYANPSQPDDPEADYHDHPA